LSRRPSHNRIHRGLAEGGFIDGKNLCIVFQWANEEAARVVTLAQELVPRADVIIASGGSVSVAAAKSGIATIPIVFAIGAHPMKVGRVSSLNRPGNSITGATSLSLELAPKRPELLKEVFPAARIAVLTHRQTPGADPLFSGRREQLVSTAAQYNIAASYVIRGYVEAGGLMSYGLGKPILIGSFSVHCRRRFGRR
jgi:putative tryptophan/tyrosine transport system substrate-binding protein